MCACQWLTAHWYQRGMGGTNWRWTPNTAVGLLHTGGILLRPLMVYTLTGTSIRKMRITFAINKKLRSWVYELKKRRKKDWRPQYGLAMLRMDENFTYIAELPHSATSLVASWCQILFSVVYQPSKYTKAEGTWLCIWTSQGCIKFPAFFDC